MEIFTKHPKTIGETYWQHFLFAMTFGGTMVIGGLACMLHAIFPFIFENTGSNFLLKLTKQFVERMPAPDDRVIVIGEIIEKKKQNPR